MNQNEHYLYINQETINRTIEQTDDFFGTDTYRLSEFWDYEVDFHGYETLIAQPQYWRQSCVDIINQKQIQCLVLTDRIIGGLFEDDARNFQTMTDIGFLKPLQHLRCLQIDPHHSFHTGPIMRISDYTPLEMLTGLESLIIEDDTEYETLVDIDFSKLRQLRTACLQFSKENVSLYDCVNIEKLTTRFYGKDFSMMQNLKDLQYLVAYAGALQTFDGIEVFEDLETLELQTTDKLESISHVGGLSNLKAFALRGAVKLASFDGLQNCKSLNELTLENCRIPDDADQLSKLKRLEKLTMDDCKKVKSLAFAKTLKNLKYLSFDGSTEILDGDLAFLKELSKRGVEIYFNDRKHYNVKLEEI